MGWVNSPLKCLLNDYPLREETADQEISKFWEFKSVMDLRSSGKPACHLSPVNMYPGVLPGWTKTWL